MGLRLLPHALRGFDADDQADFEWQLHPEYVSLYRVACSRLRTSKIAAGILNFLENQDHEIVVLVSTTPSALPNFYPAKEMARHKVGHLGQASVVVCDTGVRSQLFLILAKTVI